MKTKVTRESLAKVGIVKVDPSYLDPEDKITYLSRLQAVELKLDGMTGPEIKIMTGICESELSRFLDRYTSITDEGLYWGQAALLPGARIGPNLRSKPLKPKRSEQQGGLSGALGYTLAKTPGLAEAFANEVLRKGRSHDHGSRFDKRHLCDVFYDLCKTKGIRDDEWPLNQPRGAPKTIYQLIDDILHSDFTKAARATGGLNALIHSKVGTGYEPFLADYDVYDFIEIDSYYVDAYFVLNISGDRRTKTKDVISRFWLIAAICKRSNAVLAIKFVFSSEIRSQDLFDLICEAYSGDWVPRKSLSVKDLKYNDDGGMPSYVFPELKYHTWGAVALDNAMQHHAKKIYDLALHSLGFAINYGPLKQPARRPNVERLFKRIASKVMHQLPSTTGSSPAEGNGRVDSPEQAAVCYQVDVDEALEVMDVYTANYNGTPQGGKIKANSPLEILRDFIYEKDVLHSYTAETYINTVSLGSLTSQARVTGSVKKGIRPRIKLDQAIYTNPQLANSPHLIGVKLLLKITPHDYRTVEAYLPDGIYLGVLTVEAAWREVAHSVTTRKLINRALGKKEFRLVSGQNPIIAWNKHLRGNSSTNNNRELKRLQLETEKASLNNLTGDLEHQFSEQVLAATTERWKTLKLFS
jgi:hypothetical protein